MKPVRLVLLLPLVPTLAHAHPGHAAGLEGIAWGFAHPFSGLDHILAMLAIGLWAVQLGKRAPWLLPLSFVSGMATGAWLGMQGMCLPSVEPAILASVIGLGSVIALAAHLPIGLSAAAAAVAGLVHGQAHGCEIPTDAQGFQTAIGFIIATSLLHVLGVAGGLRFQRIAQHRAIRVAGAAILLLAVLLGFEAL
jgi:urease accessory protein